MKLQNLTVIFIIIIIPIILLQSVYISTGLKTINYQTLYDDGLLNATHDAVYAYESNMINDKYSSNAETKREILKASVKMFERSLCKTCGISEFNTQDIERYVPAIVFGMYDGFYLYAPSVIPDYRLQGYTSTGATCNLDDPNLAYTMSRPTGSYKNEHNLKSYIYYSEQLIGDITIRYTLDNYVIVSGKLKDYTGANEEYRIVSGYLSLFSTTEFNNASYDGSTFKGVNITDPKAREYFKESRKFTNWFNAYVGGKQTLSGETISKIGTGANESDPENPNSPFVQHKRAVMKSKIETVLNSTITAYSAKVWGNTFKMPNISPENWEKIYTDVSITTFFQGKNIGLTDYNGYCVLNSNNSLEYVNPSLIYFLDDNAGHYYHDIRCTELNTSYSNTKGYNISKFHGITVTGTNEHVTPVAGYIYEYYWYYRDASGDIKREKATLPDEEVPPNTWGHFNSYIYTRVFIYDAFHNFIESIYIYPDRTKTQTYQRFINADNTETEFDDPNTYIPLACYHCINASLNIDQSVYEYVTSTPVNNVKKVYWESLARERYNQPKLVEAK